MKYKRTSVKLVHVEIPTTNRPYDKVSGKPIPTTNPNHHIKRDKPKGFKPWRPPT